MPRFVILRHDQGLTSDRPLHWDFMLESGEELLTWGLEREPVYDTPLEALQLPNHRRAYLEYEGPVSGNRGVVTRWDAGEFMWRKQSDWELVIGLCGTIIQGQVRLTGLAPELHRWVVLFSAEPSDDGRCTTAGGSGLS